MIPESQRLNKAEGGTCVLGLLAHGKIHISLIEINITLRTTEGWGVISTQSLISVHRGLRMYWPPHGLCYFGLVALKTESVLSVLALDAL